MRKNRATIFLIVIFIALAFVFYKLTSNEKNKSWEKVKDETIEKCEKNEFEDAYKFLNDELENNPNCDINTEGREELESLLKRISKVKDIK